MSASFFGVLKNHNHSASVGDGGLLSNLAVTGTITGTGTVQGAGVTSTAGMTETNDASAATDVPTLRQLQSLALLAG